MIEGSDDEFKQENAPLFPGNNQLSETSKMMEEIDMLGVYRTSSRASLTT